MTPRGLILASAQSGSGKTTLTCGILRALRRRGVRARGAKAGPDYIDPGFHRVACGVRGLNLDSWAMPDAVLDAALGDAAGDADLLLIEDAMGLFDGAVAPAGRSGSASDLAARYALPVVIALDVSAQAQTAAAVLRGLAGHDPRVRVAGVVLNRVAGARHLEMIAGALAPLGLPLLGALPRERGFALPSRHLGLVQAEELEALDSTLECVADSAERHLDLDRLLALAAPLPRPRAPQPALLPPGRRIALARDAAFSFVYPHLLAAWRSCGAQIEPFSPLADEPPPADCDSCWLPGGYPELHATALAAASRFRSGLAEFARHRPVHGECGGFMVLGRTLEDAEGRCHEMTGLLSHSTSFRRRSLTLGYREAHVRDACALGASGARVRGHEFHHSTLCDRGSDEPLAELFDAQGRALGPTGGRRGGVSGSFFHAIAVCEPTR